MSEYNFSMSENKKTPKLNCLGVFIMRFQLSQELVITFSAANA